MEVLEEEELKYMREQQNHFNHLRQAAERETERLEKEEKQRLNEIVYYISYAL